MQTLQAKLEEIMSKTNLNNAKAQEIENGNMDSSKIAG